MHTVFALPCFVVVMHLLIFPYPSGLLHWHCGNLTIAPVPAKQPWWIWINTSCEFIMNDCITTTKQSTIKPCAYFLGYTVWINWCLQKTHTLITSFYHTTARLQCQNVQWCWILTFKKWRKSIIVFQMPWGIGQVVLPFRPFCDATSTIDATLQQFSVVVSMATYVPLGESDKPSTRLYTPETSPQGAITAVQDRISGFFSVFWPGKQCVSYKTCVMTSPNGIIFRVTGPWCEEFTGHRWISRTKASDAELWCFLWSSSE